MCHCWPEQEAMDFTAPWRCSDGDCAQLECLQHTCLAPIPPLLHPSPIPAQEEGAFPGSARALCSGSAKHWVPHSSSTLPSVTLHSLGREHAGRLSDLCCLTDITVGLNTLRNAHQDMAGCSGGVPSSVPAGTQLCAPQTQGW